MLNLRKGQVQDSDNCKHLRLAYSAAPNIQHPFDTDPTDFNQPTGPIVVNQLVHALMNRLWIPDNSSIVGMLDVGLSRSNFNELSKWLTHELQAGVPENTQAMLQLLEKRFRKHIDQYPEL